MLIRVDPVQLSSAMLVRASVLISPNVHGLGEDLNDCLFANTRGNTKLWCLARQAPDKNWRESVWGEFTRHSNIQADAARGTQTFRLLIRFLRSVNFLHCFTEKIPESTLCRITVITVMRKFFAVRFVRTAFSAEWEVNTLRFHEKLVAYRSEVASVKTLQTVTFSEHAFPLHQAH